MKTIRFIKDTQPSARPSISWSRGLAQLFLASNKTGYQKKAGPAPHSIKRRDAPVQDEHSAMPSSALLSPDEGHGGGLLHP